MNSTQSSRIALNMNLASLPAEIFKPYDIRGIVGQSLTPAIVERIGHAIGSEARARNMQRIAIARDGRLSGPELSKALAIGIKPASPTPVVTSSISAGCRRRSYTLPRITWAHSLAWS